MNKEDNPIALLAGEEFKLSSLISVLKKQNHLVFTDASVIALDHIAWGGDIVSSFINCEIFTFKYNIVDLPCERVHIQYRNL